MAEACSVLRAENKRSLPAWMLKSSSVNQMVKTEDPNAKTSESYEQTRNLDQTKPIKRNSGRLLKDVNSEGAGEPRVLGRSGGRGKTRKTSKNTVKDEVKEIKEVDTGRRLKKVDSAGGGELGVLRRCRSREISRRMGKNVAKDEFEEIEEEVASKNPRIVSEEAQRKISRKRKLRSSKPEASSPETIEDEIELTVEDLVSIAKEYVNADEKKQHELETAKTASHSEHSSCRTIATECTAISRNTSQYGRDESSGHQEMPCSSSFKMTGDVIQDMLNVFLGPLLKKSASSVKEPEPIESVPTAMCHVPEKKDWRSEVPSQEEPVVKKKSSLKDKVALFF